MNCVENNFFQYKLIMETNQQTSLDDSMKYLFFLDFFDIRLVLNETIS